MDPLAPVCFAVTWIAAVLAFLAGRRTAGWPGRRWVPFALFAIAAIGGLVALQRRPDLEWRCMPHRLWSHLEHVSFFPFAALFFGIALPRIPRPSTRRVLHVFLAVIAAIGLLYCVAHLALSDYRDLEGEKKGDVFLQSTGYTCSGAAMATALGGHGVPTTEGEMASLAYTIPLYGTTDFLSACAVERRLAGLPFHVDLRRLTWEELRSTAVPTLVPMQWSPFVGHMSVVLSFLHEGAHEFVWLGDPAKELYILRKEQFLERWLGYAIVITPDR